MNNDDECSKAEKLPSNLESPLDYYITQTNLAFFDKFYPDGPGNLTPNIITTFSGLSQIYGLYSLQNGNKPAFLVSWFLGHVFDNADGIFARKYNMTSEFGDWYDHVKDWTVHLGLLYLILTHKPAFPAWTLATILGVGYMTGVHFSCQESYHRGTCPRAVKSDSLDMINSKFLNFCGTEDVEKSGKYLNFTKYFGVATLELIIALFILKYY